MYEYYQRIYIEDLGKATETLARIVVIQAEIRNNDLLLI
jgi:hypothetical protein